MSYDEYQSLPSNRTHGHAGVDHAARPIRDRTLCLALPRAQPLNGVRGDATLTPMGGDPQPMKKTGTYDAPVGNAAHENAGCLQPALSPPRGFEPLSENPQALVNTAVTNIAGSVLPVCLPDSAQNDSDLAAVVDAWPLLPDAIRARILGLVEGATTAGSGG